MFSLMSWYDNLPNGAITGALQTAATYAGEQAAEWGHYLVQRHKGEAFTGGDTSPPATQMASGLPNEPVSPGSDEGAVAIRIASGLATSIITAAKERASKELRNKAVEEAVAPTSVKQAASQVINAMEYSSELEGEEGIYSIDSESDVGLEKPLRISQDGSTLTIEGLKGHSNVHFCMETDGKIAVIRKGILAGHEEINESVNIKLATGETRTFTFKSRPLWTQEKYTGLRDIVIKGEGRGVSARNMTREIQHDTGGLAFVSPYEKGYRMEYSSRGSDVPHTTIYVEHDPEIEG